MSERIPIIDLFAGPGGLGEGFSAFQSASGQYPFEIALSIEKEPQAHQTLTLRAFFRQFPPGQAPKEYYQYLRSTEEPERIRRERLFDAFPVHAERARQTALLEELSEASTETVRGEIHRALGDVDGRFILLGGPPCQAYSVMGRSRNKGIKDYDPTQDVRQKLYVEYLQVIADHQPAVFVMENVKGLLSATLKNKRVLDHILEDLASPAEALQRENRELADKRRKPKYDLYSLAPKASLEATDPRQYMIRMEEHGIPQARHRLIIVGVRRDLETRALRPLKKSPQVNVDDVLFGLPSLRSGLSRETDSLDAWRESIHSIKHQSWIRNGALTDRPGLRNLIVQYTDAISESPETRGGEYVPHRVKSRYQSGWFVDGRIRGVCNHNTRSHIAQDLHRYLYAACYAENSGRSPDLRDFPADLLPRHKNAQRAVEDGTFDDRFHVQVWNRPSSTVTSHLAKDGHYFIHPDPSQCRSMTVREVARLQTFPDNYFFCGPRTAQYTQVGNAVPPMLACQIAESVYIVLKEAGVV